MIWDIQKEEHIDNKGFSIFFQLGRITFQLFVHRRKKGWKLERTMEEE